MALELHLGGPVLKYFKGPHAIFTEYDRGFSYLVVFSFPFLGWLWISGRRLLIPLLLVPLFITGLGDSWAARLALLLGLGAVLCAAPHAHNVLMQLWVEMGVMGVGLGVGFARLTLAKLGRLLLLVFRADRSDVCPAQRWKARWCRVCVNRSRHRLKPRGEVPKDHFRVDILKFRLLRFPPSGVASESTRDDVPERGGKFPIVSPVRTASVAALILALPLMGCSGVLDPHGPVGASERLILLDSLAIMLAVIVPIIVATFAFAWWFRASNPRAIYRPDWTFSGTLELIVWAIPALVIMFLGGIAWYGSAELDPFAPLVSKVKPIQVEVVSLDWKWLFIYPDEGIATVNQLVIPVGTPVHFQLTSSGVMNSFFIPQLGSQIYTMAGMDSQLNLQADTAGTYHGISAQFSGQGFAGMHFETRAVSKDDYAAWVAATKVRGPVLDRATYNGLAQPSENAVPATYKSVVPNLFQAIVGQTTASAPPMPMPMTMPMTTQKGS